MFNQFNLIVQHAFLVQTLEVPGGSFDFSRQHDQLESLKQKFLWSFLNYVTIIQKIIIFNQ